MRAVAYAPGASTLVRAGDLPLPRVDDAVHTLFVIPEFNEAENLPRLLSDLEGRPERVAAGSRVIVSDDESTDGTPLLAEAHEGDLVVDVVRRGENKGPGAAFRAGFDAALSSCGDEALIVTLEADTTSD